VAPGTLRLEGVEHVQNPEDDDVFIYSGRIHNLNGDDLRRPSHIGGRQDRHVFFHCADHETLYDTSAMIIRCNTRVQKATRQPLLSSEFSPQARMASAVSFAPYCGRLDEEGQERQSTFVNELISATTRLWQNRRTDDPKRRSKSELGRSKAGPHRIRQRFEFPRDLRNLGELPPFVRRLVELFPKPLYSVCCDEQAGKVVRRLFTQKITNRPRQIRSVLLNLGTAALLRSGNQGLTASKNVMKSSEGQASFFLRIVTALGQLRIHTTDKSDHSRFCFPPDVPEHRSCEPPKEHLENCKVDLIESHPC
jgi:hypothetical protein